MKKNNFIYPAIFLVIVLFLFIIPIGVFLTSEVLGKEIAKSKWCFIYGFFKDHGSLIAGLFAIAGVAWMVNTQKAETDKMIKEERDRVRRERFYQDKESAFEQLYLLGKKFKERRQIGVLLKKGEKILTPENFSQKYLDHIFDNLYHLDMYIVRCDGGKFLKNLTRTARSCFNLIQETLYYEDHGDRDVFLVYGYKLEFNLNDLKEARDQESEIFFWDGFDFSVVANGKKYLLTDIIKGISNNKEGENLEELSLYLEICFIWLRGIFDHGVRHKIEELTFKE